MIVYRLESTQDGYGFWTGYGRGDLLDRHTGEWERGCTVRPRGYSFMFGTSREYRYGCDSLERLKKYFGTAYDGIIKSGKFTVVKYKIRKSKYNVIFGADNIELVFAIEKAERLSEPFKYPERPERSASPFGMGTVVFDEAATIDTEAFAKLKIPEPTFNLSSFI